MKAPEFQQDLRWIHSPGLTLKELRGKVVLIDFWTYSCVNCIRTLPHVKRWHERYAAKGLVVIGIHTPEFEFEKDLGNVQRTVKEFGIEYPVVIDNDYEMWSRYANRVWPHKYLLNKEGHLVYDHAGEGAYAETEAAIQAALKEIDPAMELPNISASEGSGAVCVPGTPEIYLGSLRGRQGKTWRAEGVWRAYQDFTEHERETSDFEDKIVFSFNAAEVNVVAEHSGERPARVKIMLNGKEEGEIEIKEPKMYRLLSLPQETRGELALLVRDDRVRFYAFTFGGCRSEKSETRN